MSRWHETGTLSIVHLPARPAIISRGRHFIEAVVTIRSATQDFERWLQRQTPIVRSDLRHKHAAMKSDPFSFLRATYYRWAQQFAELESTISGAPKTLAVGDLHLENFGTWRDELGRLAWGINDFDEAYPLPYTHDLVRLAASAMLAIGQNRLRLKLKTACTAIIEGYREGLKCRGRAFVIGDYHRWFKPILSDPPRDPGRFWDHLKSLPRESAAVSSQAKAAIKQLLPEPGLRLDIRHRIAGLGNLGKPRHTALAEWNGGPIAREVKVLTLSAAAWACAASDGPYYAQILSGAVRSADPFLIVHKNWIVRRLAPDSRRIELASLIRVKDEEWLLHAMGFETANVHLGTPASRRPILAHLQKQSKGWLRKAATAMHAMVMKDFVAW